MDPVTAGAALDYSAVSRLLQGLLAQRRAEESVDPPARGAAGAARAPGATRPKEARVVDSTYGSELNYTPAAAARLLGVSERRVRQMLDEGILRRLPSPGARGARIAASSVEAERLRRRYESGRGGAPTNEREVVEEVVRQLAPVMLEPLSSMLHQLQAQLTEEMRQRVAAEARVRRLEATVQRAREYLRSRGLDPSGLV